MKTNSPRWMMASILVIVSLLSVFCLQQMVFAQSTAATLSGTVTDETGAVVPGAVVVILNPATGAQRQVTTSNEGYFVFPLLAPGNYTITAQHGGFSPVELKNVILNVNDQRSLQIQLKVGSLSQAVTVTENASLIQDSAAVATVINPHFVDNLPLNGRTFQALLMLVPGVVPGTGDARQFNVNGQRGLSNSTSIDGVSANLAGGFGVTGFTLYSAGSAMGVTSTGTTQAIATMDELQEFTVQTSGYGAELGRQSGAQISFATKSGTNQFHGSAYEYFRNEILDANDWFLNRQGLKRPKLRQNDFGGTFGGPIIKDKTFFFLALEDDPLLTPYVNTTTVPTQAYKNAAAPAVTPLLGIFPLPNGAIAANGLSGAYLLSDSVRDPVNAESLKLDQNIGNRLTMFARYHRAPSQTATPSGYVSTMAAFFSNTQTGTYGATWTVTPRTVDQLRFNWSRSSSGSHYVFRSMDGTTPAPDSALRPPGYSAADGVVTLYLLEPSFTAIGSNLGRNVTDIQRQYQLTDSISLVRGKHKIDVGADWRRMAPSLSMPKDSQQLIITSAATAQARATATAFGSGQFLLNSLSLYAADTWKFSPRLTLNLGVRWELEPAPHASQNPQFFAAQNFDSNNLAVATLAPQGTPIWKMQYKNFAPRLGAAYHLHDKPGRDTVLRGAFGVYYDMGVGDPMGFLASAPYSRFTSVTGTYPAILSDPAILPPPANLNPPFVSLKLFDPNLQMPYTLSWNLGVQQSLGQSQSLSADYVGNRGKRLLMAISRAYPGNPLITATGSLQEETNLAASWYDALQVQFNRRLAHGLQVLANYTLSRSDDLASDETTFSIPGGAIPVATNRGPSAYDVRHNFTAAATWQIPAPFANRALKAALGGWSLNPLVRAYSAKPISPFYNYSVTGVVSYQLRPDVVPGQPVWLTDPTVPGGKRLNIAAFSVPKFTDPSQLRQGTAVRNSIRGFPATQEDIAVRRDFKVTERIGLQFSGEIYNIFNHPNFNNPTASYGTYSNGAFSAPSTATFGLATQMLSNAGGAPTNALPIYAFGGQRDIQFALKITF